MGVNTSYGLKEVLQQVGTEHMCKYVKYVRRNIRGSPFR